MSLNEYKRKRDFKRTREPAPGKASAAPAGPLIFCVQKHAASHLHYDLRLEMQGVLKSWAVPKGPSMNPADRRLAMKVEDHPLEYADFEGTIPEGNYGAGTVELWDRGEYLPVGDLPPEKQLDDGKLVVQLKGRRLRGEFALVRMKGKAKGKSEPWLLLKHHDEFANDREGEPPLLEGKTRVGDKPSRKRPVSILSGKLARVRGARKAEMPRNPAPMLATPADKAPTGKGWLFEIKWDGVRALGFLDAGAVELRGRSGTNLTRQFPELQELAQALDARQAVVDAEIVALDEQGRSDFQALQPRIMTLRGSRLAEQSHPVVLQVFDLLYCDGYDLRAVPLRERKRLLAEWLHESPHIRLSTHMEGRGEELLASAREHGLEGILAKDASSSYESRRSSAWRKIKLVEEQDCVLCGYTAGRRETFASLVLGLYQNRKLIYVGNVGTGFDERQQKQIRSLLDQHASRTPPFAQREDVPGAVTWTRPEVVCRVKYAQWTRDRRLRAPVFLGLRFDVPPEQCIRETATTAMREGSTSDGGSVTPRRMKAEPGSIIPAQRETAEITRDGHRLKLTHLRKLYFPADGLAKADLLAYYASVAPVMLPHLDRRPLSLRRYPNGIRSQAFFQKDAARGIPDWLQATEPHDPETKYIVCRDLAGLLFLTNLGCIDHNPWMSRVESIDSPDYILLDLDPYQCSYAQVIEAALRVRRLLDACGLVSFPKTSGGDGFHIYIPIRNGYSYDQARDFSEMLSRAVIRQSPELFTTPRSVQKRVAGRVYFDYLQIGKGKTIAAPYSVRAHDGAPVSAPLRWSEVNKRLRSDQFTLKNIGKRIERYGDLFAEVLGGKQPLDEARSKLEPMLRD